MACEEAPATTADTPRIALAFDEEIENQTGDSRGRRPLTLECAAGATLFYSTRLAMALAPPQMAARARRLRCVYREGFGRVVEGEYPRLTKTMLTPCARPPAGFMTARGGESSNKHRSITEFKSFETLSFGGSPGRVGSRSGDGAYRHPLVQHDECGREFAVVRGHTTCQPATQEPSSNNYSRGAYNTAHSKHQHTPLQVHAVCLDSLEELDETAEGKELWQALSWEESMDFIETLLRPAAKPPHVAKVDWRPGDVIVFDNLMTQHSVTPTDTYTTVKGVRRLMTRTAYQPELDVLNT